ncbi:hypothetical protein L1987_14537 [Smallanthus sonchifolius]|uniref:Uncharacterized protein n=1 Tax=Smallanthus sonchifolius TaxID=185202 RepID=A0ACB9J3N7_9ASTR|nr:hypothetical protein L1987_14537 [Smallanthus sonchifolius]
MSQRHRSESYRRRPFHKPTKDLPPAYLDVTNLPNLEQRKLSPTMSRVAISAAGDVDFGGLMSHLLDVPDAIGKVIFPSSRSHHESSNGESKGNIPVDILDTPKELIMYMDVPGLSKSDIQVTN